MSLQEVRKQRNLSQRECAEHSGINVRILQFYEQGVRDINGAKLSTLLKLCNALECRLEDILTDQETLTELERYIQTGIKAHSTAE